MTANLTSSYLKTYMDTYHIAGEILHLDVPTPTVETAAQTVGAHPDQIVKSVLFLIDGKPLLAVAFGTSHIDRRNIAERYGVGRKRVKLADADTVLRYTGYPAGAVPPFGHLQTIPTILDPGVLHYEQVYAGGGSNSALVRIDPKEILRITRAEIIQLIEQHSDNMLPNSS